MARRTRTVDATAEELHEAHERAEAAGREKKRDEIAKEFSLEAVELDDIKARLNKILEEVAGNPKKFANVTDAEGIPRRQEQQRLVKKLGEALIEHFEGFNPTNNDEDTAAYLSLLYVDASQYAGAEEVEMARDRRREEQAEALDVFRRKMHETVGDLVWLAQQDTPQAGVLIIGIMESALSQGEDISNFKKQFEEDFGYIEDDQKAALYEALEEQGRLGPIPFRDFVKNNFGETPDDPERLNISTTVRNIETDIKEAHREFI